MTGHAERPAGSPAAGEPALLAVGKIRRPHGLIGDVLVEIYTDFPDRLQPGVQVQVGDKFLPLTICRLRFHSGLLLLAFDGYTTPEQVGFLRNQVIYIQTSQAAELAEGEFYFHELLGISVLNETGENLGTVTEILRTGANDVYVVTDNVGREVLLPAIPDVILDVDLDARKMKVHLLPGLLEEDEPQHETDS
jgi:16S rRNA processing protein RimM